MQAHDYAEQQVVVARYDTHAISIGVRCDRDAGGVLVIGAPIPLQ